MDHFVKNFLFQLKKGKKKKKKKKRSRSNDFGSDEYSYSILNSDPRISEYLDTRSSPIVHHKLFHDGRTKMSCISSYSVISPNL